ncbi:TonB-dependent receptor plug domain-containing protein [Hydrogenophaga sp. RWCD_12]|uniref:TonB-dependent receptor plug domain-containing protein n=1 Tax=Hydrogenophaga sp. RWCD_12 TaxID=3391190 RepID=UPI0039848472
MHQSPHFTPDQPPSPSLRSGPQRLCRWRQGAALTLLALAAQLACAESAQDPMALSLEELMNIEVSSVAKKPQRLLDAASAVYVLGREDIRRSGATTLPDLLRLVPGVQVARIDASRFSVSIRGFGNRYSGKLLVLQDGRTLYSPLFSGTYWEVQDVLMDDIERIEVIRGPGGTLWGANAVNGVINIITRQAGETQGVYAQATAGTQERGMALRYGTSLGQSGHLRAYAKLDEHDAQDVTPGVSANDGGHSARLGFRADLKPAAGDSLTVQGDVYDTSARENVQYSTPYPPMTSFVPSAAKYSGSNLMLRWERTRNSDESWHVQSYVDHTALTDLLHHQSVLTFDTEWQHRIRLNPAHEITWGLGYRRVMDEIQGSYTLEATPVRMSTSLYSGFVQDEVRLGDDLQLTLGSKLEHNDFTGFEWQPSARLLWRLSHNDSLWGAVSRAVLTPSRSSRDVQMKRDTLTGVPGLPVPVLVRVEGSQDMVSERLVSTEIGYRSQISKELSVDVSGYYNRYEDLVTVSPGNLRFDPAPVLPMKFGNQMNGHTYGVELSGQWQVNPAWRLKGGYGWQHLRLRATPGSNAVLAFGSEGSSAQNVLQLSSQHRLGNDWELDANLFYMGPLKSIGRRSAFGPSESGRIDGYTRLDLRLGWKPRPGVELNLIGRNLLQRRHQEYIGDDITASQVPRSVLLQATWAY